MRGIPVYDQPDYTYWNSNLSTYIEIDEKEQWKSMQCVFKNFVLPMTIAPIIVMFCYVIYKKRYYKFLLCFFFLIEFHFCVFPLYDHLQKLSMIFSFTTDTYSLTMVAASFVMIKLWTILLKGPTIGTYLFTTILTSIIALNCVIIVPYELLLAMFMIISFCILIVLLQKMKTTLESQFKNPNSTNEKKKIIVLSQPYETEPFLPVHFEFLSPNSNSILDTLMTKENENMINNDFYRTILYVDINRTPLYFWDLLFLSVLFGKVLLLDDIFLASICYTMTIIGLIATTRLQVKYKTLLPAFPISFGLSVAAVLLFRHFIYPLIYI
uniref:Signal peptide peptidase family protein n=1 Tax=Parastrongyloides trichosuri TaxID=131310 RepID=A0A0N4ZKA0_PARTI